MKTKTAVIALCIGAVIAAIVLVAINWPELPERTLPQSVQYVPMSGETVAAQETGCLAAVIGEMRKRPNWVIRIDDMRWTDVAGSPDGDPKHGTITIDANGATWQSGWITSQSLLLTDVEQRDVFAAFDLGCKKDESLPHNGFEGRYIAVAYGRTEKAAAQLEYNSPVVVRLGELFEQIRARYIAGRAAIAKGFVIEVAGVRRTGGKGDRDEYTKYTWKYEEAKSDDEVETKVDLLDWVLAQPATRPKGRKTALGTLTHQGVTKPIAISLDWNEPGNLVLQRYSLASELSIWMSINHDGGE